MPFAGTNTDVSTRTPMKDPEFLIANKLLLLLFFLLLQFQILIVV